MSKQLQTIDDLTEDPSNANKGTPRGGALLDRSLDEVGAGRAPVADSDGVVLAGNKTIEKWRAKGGKVEFVHTKGDTLVVVVRDDLNLARAPKKARALAYLDNQTAALNLAYDPAIVEADRASGIIDFESLGIFKADELAGIVAAVGGGSTETPADVDAVPVVKTTKIKRGDLFALGRHLLLCGDATKRADVERLMGTKRADLMFTDPPYGVQFKSKEIEARAIQGDLSQAAIPLSFAVAVDHALTRDARLYVCGGQDNATMYIGLFDHHLQMTPRFIIWDKGHFVMRRNGYHSQFEIIYFGWRGKGGGPSFWFGDRRPTDLWTVKRDPESERVHPTQKPVELARRAILNSCPHGGIVFEPFVGSGSTLAAAEVTGRVCYAMDLDSLYCQTTIDRWQGITKKKAEQRGNAADGRRTAAALKNWRRK